MSLHHSLYNHRALRELPDCEDGFDQLVFDRIERDVTRALASPEPHDWLHGAGLDPWGIEIKGDGQSIQQGDLTVQLLDLMRDVLAVAATHSDAEAGAVALRRLQLIHSQVIESAQADAGAQKSALDDMLAEHQNAREDAAFDKAGV